VDITWLMMKVDRRAIVIGLPALAVAHRPVGAQTVAKPSRVGFGASGFESEYRAFLEGLRDLGWADGRNVVIERRTDGERRVDELLQLKLDVIVLNGPTRIKQALDRTKALSIVGIDLESDPVASGFVRSLAHPGGSVTGIWLDLPDLAGKLLQFLREVVPRLTVTAVLWDGRIGAPQFAALQEAARSIGVRVHPVVMRERGQADASMRRAVALKPQAQVVLTSPPISAQLPRIAEAALQSRLPSISLFTDYPRSGGLIGYGPNLVENYRRLAYFVDQILEGGRPLELPVERPAKFELVLNARTARALGLSIPPILLSRADQLVE
jgi:ABC-type uncharacterized transport system substrate-binding protein